MRPLMLVLLLLALAVPESASAAPVCGPSKAKTLAAGKLTRIYVSRKEGPVHACTRGFKARRHLGETYCYGSSSGCSTVAEVAVSGHFAAAAVQDCCDSYGDAYFTLTVRDVATGDVVERRSFGRVGVSMAWIVAIVLRPTGAAAWLWKRIEFRRPRPNESLVVTRSDRCGEPATLADSPSINGFWRSGASVFWREAGVERSAPLC